MSGSGPNLPVRISVEGVPQAEQAFNRVAQTGQAAMQRVQTGADAAGGATGRFGQAAGQAGFQIQDFATQVSMGQNALTAFSTQASQFLGIFGTTGAIAGALLTVGVLAAQLLKIGENSDDAGEAINALAKSLADASRDGDRLADTLARIEARFMSAAEAARQQRMRGLGTDVQELGRLGVDATLRAANRDQDAAQAEARRSFLSGQLDRGLSFTEEADIRRELRDLEGTVESARRDAANLRREAARLDFNRVRTENLLRGEYEDGTNANPGRLDPEAREGRGGREPRPPGEFDVQAAISRSPVVRAQQELNRYNEEINLHNAGLDRAAGLLASYERQQQTLRTALEQGVITEEQFGAEVERTSLRLGEQIDALGQRAQGVDSMGREIGMTFSSAFEDAIVKGERFSKVLQGVAQDLARIVIRQTITAPLGNAIAKSVQGIDFGSILNFGGPREAGGPVYAGSTYLVGERGPEMFTPSTSGAIVPNGAMGGVSFAPTYNIDARGADASMLPRLRAEMAAIAQASVAQLVDQVQRGGSAARVFGRRA